MSSIQAFREWAVAARQVSNPQTGSYPGQCVSLVQQYLYQVFGVPYAPRGNAKDFVPVDFERVNGSARPGDIVRYGANYGGGYGHIGIIDDDGRFLDQNGVAVLHVGQRDVPFGGIESIWRSTRPFNVKMPGGVAEAIRPTMVRVSPNTNAALGGSQKLLPGQTFSYKRIVDGETVTQNGITTNKWAESSKGNFVWLGNLKLLN
jgi:cell wall-associated NlpC family hydrolase